MGGRPRAPPSGVVIVIVMFVVIVIAVSVAKSLPTQSQQVRDSGEGPLHALRNGGSPCM